MPLQTTLFGLVFLAVLMFEGMIGTLLSYRSWLLEHRLGVRTNAVQEAAWSKWSKLKKLNNPFRGLAGRLSKGGDRESLVAKIRAAGLENKLTVETLVSMKLIIGFGSFAVLSTLGVFGLGMAAVGVGFMVGALGYMTPEIWLNWRVGTRRSRIEKGLLTFVTMLGMTCEAGLSLNEALERVAYELGGQMGEEISRILAETKMGVLRAKAFKDAAERYDSADLKMVFQSIATADEHGTPIVEVLKETARQLRQVRKNRAQVLTQKASVKIVLPVMIFMFIPLAVLVIGPIMAQLLRALSW